jgi:hypothetical protein
LPALDPKKKLLFSSGDRQGLFEQSCLNLNIHYLLYNQFIEIIHFLKEKRSNYASLREISGQKSGREWTRTIIPLHCVSWTIAIS